MFVIGLVVGLLVGGALTYPLAALMLASSLRDKETEDE